MTNYDDPDTLWESVQMCPVHPEGESPIATEWENCIGCRAEQVAREAVMDQMMAEAKERMKGIAQAGGPQMPPWDMLSVRLDVLLESIFRDPRNRTRYEGEVGRRTLVMIKAMQEQIKQPTLHVAKGNAGITDIRGGKR